MAGGGEADVLVAGAGAAGLTAAAEAAAAGARVLVLEANRRPGVKIRISGGGRCNLAADLDPVSAEPLFGRRGGRFLRHGLRAVPSERIRGWVEERGVETVVEEDDKVFPASGRSADVVRALVARAVAAGAQIRCSERIAAVRPRAGGWWATETLNGACHRARSLILAVGGASWPRAGTRGEGYRWLAALGLPVVEPIPALVPLRSPAAWVRGLQGLSLRDVEVQLRTPGGRILVRRRRPVLFTHFGLSGPGPMDLSARWQREAGRAQLHLDLAPDRDSAEVEQDLFRGKGGVAGRLRRIGVPKRLAETMLRLAGLGNPPAAEVPGSGRRAVVASVKGLAVPVEGTLGFAQAETTAGGLDLAVVDPRTMEVRGRPGLFVCGELLDLDGPIGGFSFWIAFATGFLAGRAAAARAQG